MDTVSAVTVGHFINALGGTIEVAAALELAPTTVSSWKSSGSIPKWRMDAVKRFAKRKGVPVPEAFA